jgi:ER membrane protein complex subunit 1
LHSDSFSPFKSHWTYSYLLQTALELGTTQTRHGITTPALLFSTIGGGLLMLDRKLIDPRRPVGEPSVAEKTEGLMQYSPILPLRHQWLLTHSGSVPHARLVVSTPSSYESTSFVALLGECTLGMTL